MMRQRLPILVVVLVFVGLLGARGAWALEPGAFLPPGSVDGEALLGPPPQPGSAEFAQDTAIVLWLQRTRTPEQVAFVREELDLQRFVPLLGASLLEVDGRALAALFERLIAEVKLGYDSLKDHYGKPRPFVANDAVHPVAEARPVASYPSGHATRATVYGLLLTEIFPEHEAGLMELARQIGYGRVIGGVHYPSDVLAGEKLGTAYAAVIAGRPAFKAAVGALGGGGPPE